MSWLMKNGSYPYLENMTAPALGCFAHAAKLRTVRFQGTAAQWKNVRCGSQWCEHAPFAQVECADAIVPELPADTN